MADEPDPMQAEYQRALDMQGLGWPLDHEAELAFVRTFFNCLKISAQCVQKLNEIYQRTKGEEDYRPKSLSATLEWLITAEYDALTMDDPDIPF